MWIRWWDSPLRDLFSDSVGDAVDVDPLPGADAAHAAEGGDHVEERRGAEGGHRVVGEAAVAIGNFKDFVPCLLLTVTPETSTGDGRGLENSAWQGFGGFWNR